jgi:glycerophosphoryl diester phosphodiesterase
MLVLSHRGYWRSAAEKNTAAAFARSFNHDFGTETDLRDLGGTLVVSHDPPMAGALPADDFFGIYRGINRDLPLALNIKSDGLQPLLMPLLTRYEVMNFFVFDMAVPDALGWLRVGAPTFTRHSDIEREPAFYHRAAGVWLDGFESDWWNPTVIRRHLNAGKRVCVVSPDLHGREPRRAWDVLTEFRGDARVMLCTDRPEEAREVCGG